MEDEGNHYVAADAAVIFRNTKLVMSTINNGF